MYFRIETGRSPSTFPSPFSSPSHCPSLYPSNYTSTYHISNCPLSPLSMTLFLTVSLLLCLSFSLSAKLAISRAAYSHTKIEALLCSNMHEPEYVCVYRASRRILTCDLEVEFSQLHQPTYNNQWLLAND